MLPTEAISEVARRQLRDYRAGTPGTVFSQGIDLTIADAYVIQLEVARLRQAEGEEVAGYKVGCTGPNIRKQFGMDGPISGVVWAGEVHSSGATVAAQDYADLAIEGELAALIGDKAEPVALLPVIELHNYVFRASTPCLQELIANNGMHAGVVRADGSPFPWQPGRAIDGSLQVFVNGRLVETGSLSGVPGGPTGSLRWLRAHLSGLGLALAPGQLVLTGAPLSLLPVAAGDTIRVVAQGIGEVSVEVS